MRIKMNLRRNVPRIFTLFLLLVLSVFIISSCGGGGGAVVAPLLPTVMTVGVPIIDTVVLNGFNEYTASVTPGKLYKISITGLTDDADLEMFGSDSTFTTLATCSVDNTAIAGLSSEDCILAAPPGGAIFFAVDGTFLTTSAGTYTIDIELLTVINTTLSIPLPDSKTQMRAGVYSVNVPSGAYTVSITGLDDDADLYVFGNDSTFTTKATCFPDNTFIEGTAPEDCTLKLNGGTLNFIVDDNFSMATTVHYTALATPAPAIPDPTNEGTKSVPIVLSSETPTMGQVGFGGTSYYEATNLIPGRYTISITGLTADVDLFVYSDNFTTLANCLIDNTTFVGLFPEDCTLQVSGTTLFFTVSAETLSDGAAYIILVEPGP